MSQLFDEAVQFTDEDTGELLVGGLLYIGSNGLDAKLNPITIYPDRELAGIPLANPQTIGSDGRSANKIWVAGKYSFKVEDSANVQKYNELENGVDEKVSNTLLINALGTNDIVTNGSPTVSTLIDNQTYIFTAPADNTGAMTLKIDSTAIMSLKIHHDQALASGDIKASQKVVVVANLTDSIFEVQTDLSGVTLNGVETLTNKTLTAPGISGATINTSTINTSTINSPDIDQVVDSSDNEIHIFAEVASAVNEITETNAASGNKPSLNQTGTGDVGIDVEGVELHNGVVTGSFTGALTGEASTVADASVTSAKFASDVGYRELIQTITASADATIDFDNKIDGTYKRYIVKIENLIPATDGQALRVRVQTGGSTWQTGAVYTTSSAIGIAYINILSSLENAAVEGGYSGDVKVYDPSSTSVHTQISADGSYINSVDGFMDLITIGVGKYEATTAVTGIRFYMSSGNIASGTFTLYGVE